jgi:hypothetical protein
LDLFQVQNDEGPCLECSTTGQRVVDEDLSPKGPWPGFSHKARENNFNAVYALPLRSRNLTVGALNLFATENLSEGQLIVAQALADSATLSLLQVDPEVDLQIVIRRIHIAVESKNTVEQAQGMIAQRFSIDIEEAFVRLRETSLHTKLTLHQVALAVVQRDQTSPVAKLL